MKNLIFLATLVFCLAAQGCSESESGKSKAEITKEWQDKSDVPKGYIDASKAMSGGGAPKGSGPVNPPPGVGGGR